jgi:hypothetical protein
MQSHIPVVGESHSVGLSEQRKLKEATKMKRLLRLSVLVLALIAVLLVLAGPVAAKATKTEFTATETYVKDLVSGKEWYTGRNGEIYHWRGNQQLYDVVASDPRVSGDEIITLNLDMKLVDDPDVWATGRMWGTETLS